MIICGATVFVTFSSWTSVFGAVLRVYIAISRVLSSFPQLVQIENLPRSIRCTSLLPLSLPRYYSLAISVCIKAITRILYLFVDNLT